jgi:organic radical activating enzyme
MLIHGFISRSRVNGPGLRAVVYFQGCSLGCPNCWNLESHAFMGEEWSIPDVMALVVSAHHECPLNGVTFSGGEPMQQAEALLALIGAVRDQVPELSIGMYSGYSEQELTSGRYWCRSEVTWTSLCWDGTSPDGRARALSGPVPIRSSCSFQGATVKRTSAHRKSKSTSMLKEQFS